MEAEDSLAMGGTPHPISLDLGDVVSNFITPLI
jgi:hypothetical protein